MPPLKKPKPKKPKPKKPKKPVMPAKVKKPTRQGKPNPDKPKEKKPGKKPQKPIKPHPHPRSGFIPVACRPLIRSPDLLDCWLEHIPRLLRPSSGRYPRECRQSLCWRGRLGRLR